MRNNLKPLVTLLFRTVLTVKEAGIISAQLLRFLFGDYHSNYSFFSDEVETIFSHVTFQS